MNYNVVESHEDGSHLFCRSDSISGASGVSEFVYTVQTPHLRELQYDGRQRLPEILGGPREQQALQQAPSNHPQPGTAAAQQHGQPPRPGSGLVVCPQLVGPLQQSEMLCSGLPA